jgi:xylan 1,4-beta-xylosidase
MKNAFGYLILTLTFILGIQVKTVNSQTYCNPLDLSYPFRTEKLSEPDIADPTIVLFKDNYFLFATNAGGYWYSSDLLSWKFISEANLPFERLEPTAVAIGDWIYFFTSLNDKIYRSKDPVSGKWEAYSSSVLLAIVSDFAVFADTDGKVYCYYGCSNHDGVMVREMDPKNMLNPIGVPVTCKKINPLKSNRAKPKANTDKSSNNVKGSWMTKYNGKYYYQCAELNSDLNRFGDVVYVGETPLGPFKYAANNPFSFRPDGFVCGAGNGSTFADKYGNWWHIATMTAPTKNESHSSLGLFPAGFDKDGDLFTKTDFGDYPIIMPKQKYTNVNKLDPEWALLSDKLTIQASSILATYPVTFAFDENIGTYWSAQTGEKGEWLSVDLGSVCTINAFQLNFAENITKVKGSDGVPAYQYLVEYSIDKKIWKKLSDKTTNTEYQTNPYEELIIPVQAQYLKITNFHVPVGTFAISGFRVFGSGTDHKPRKVSEFRAVRDYRDPQVIKMSWKKQDNTSGYNIRYGTDKDKLYHSYQVYKNTRLTIQCPDKSKTYWFEMDAFNDNGVTPGKILPSK